MENNGEDLYVWTHKRFDIGYNGNQVRRDKTETVPTGLSNLLQARQFFEKNMGNVVF